MNIKEIRAVSLNIPKSPPKTPARREGWNTHARRALPINKYPEFPRMHGQMPGANTFAEVWVQVTAEDGSWGHCFVVMPFQRLGTHSPSP